MTPRLLNLDAARAYCGDVDPHKVCAPRRFGRSVRWDREELDAAGSFACGCDVLSANDLASLAPPPFTARLQPRLGGGRVGMIQAVRE